MKTKLLLHFIILVLLNMSIFDTTAQNLTNYNLYSQNAFLYNPAAAIEKPWLSAYANSHLQWLGFDGAPQTNTFGISAPIFKSMGLGLTIANNKQSIQNDFLTRLSYAYRVEISDNQLLLLGASLGFMSNKLSFADAENIELGDPILTADDYNAMSLIANAGLIYSFKDFEAQLAFPQLTEKKGANLYTIGILSYTFKYGSNWAFKPSVLARGNKTTPWQMDYNITSSYTDVVWGQLGYRTNNSFLFGVGLNYKTTSIGYVYELDNNVLAKVSNGTHEIQFIVSMGSALFKPKPKTSNFSGIIKNALTGSAIPNATVVIKNQKGEEVGRTVTNNEGAFSAVLKLKQSYTVSATAEEYTNANELVAIGETETNKTLDLMLKPTKTMLSGNVVPKNATINITDETGTVVFSGKPDENGNYQVKVDIGKSYKVELTADDYVAKTETLKANENNSENNLNTVLTPLVRHKNLIAKIFNKDTGEPVTATTTIYDSTGKIIDSKEVAGTYRTELPPGSYKVEIKGKGIITMKEEIVITDDSEKEYAIEIKVKALSKDNTFQLGNIEFLSGTAKLSPASYPVLDELVKIMKEDENLKLEVGGHTDDVGSESGNAKLSMQRADAVMNYAISKGIAKERLSAKGYGESAPLVPNTSAENRAKNRRVEFKVIK